MISKNVAQAKLCARAALVGSIFWLSGCVQGPMGPTVAVMPAAGKPFDVFVKDEAVCRQFAAQQAGITSQDAANNAVIGDAAVGTAVGAVAGAAIGGTVGRPLEGAAIGAGGGLVEGSVIGAGAGYGAAANAQQRFNVAYEQCMYAKGNQIPNASPAYQPPPQYAAQQYQPPPSYAPPPPPPGYIPPR